jgi:hypothetical protein
MPDPSSIIGQRGRLVGAHPWAGHSGEIVRIEETLVGFGVVVRIDPGNDVPPGQEAFVFDCWLHWRPEGPIVGKPLLMRPGDPLPIA